MTYVKAEPEAPIVMLLTIWSQLGLVSMTFSRQTVMSSLSGLHEVLQNSTERLKTSFIINQGT
jgi:hypothetical protein